MAGTEGSKRSSLGTGGVNFGGLTTLYSTGAGALILRNGVDSGYADLDLQNINVLRGGTIDTGTAVNLTLNLRERWG